MRFLSLDLPPLTLILLLAFLWLILLVLLLWSWLRPRRTSETDPQRERDASRRTRPERDDTALVDEPRPRLPRPQIVRETTPKAQDDAFDNFNPKKRDDDFDF